MFDFLFRIFILSRLPSLLVTAFVPTGTAPKLVSSFGLSLTPDRIPISATNNNDNNESENDDDVTSSSIVSSLTSFVNLFMGDSAIHNDNTCKAYKMTPPKSPQDLMEKIKNDYIVNNYLWTGDIYIPAFEPDCQFTDPTLTFTGTDTFTRNVKNLVPIVDFLTSKEEKEAEEKEKIGGGGGGSNRGKRSDLLDIRINEEEEYIET
mmetsp:Transcript_25329/g.31213  ORF Transcript_25329/g.31213 Transcript_25329/m.31213 type:complete len:206 (+) Transcript_25329:22-639(+)